MKKMAVFNYSGVSKNKGGPNGYLYNLFNGLEEIREELPLFSISQLQGGSKTKKRNLDFNIPFVKEIRAMLHFYKKGFLCAKKINKDLHNYETIHAHSCEDVYYLRKYIKFNGNIILTSHRPESLAEEKITLLRLKNDTKWSFPLLKAQMEYVEKYGYKEAQGFIFPSEGAMEIYKKFPGFVIYSKNKPVEFVFTGAPKNVPSISMEEYRKKICLNKEDRILCYIGRHNYIKGYDLLTSLSSRFITDDIKVICAGPNDLLPSPHSENWYEMGYIKDPYNLINASDVVVIPNRNTYFDLIIVEVLSQGKIVITSDTGGNLDIAKKTNGIRLFKSGDSEALYNTIIETFKLSPVEKEILVNNNIEYYNNYCTLNRFASNYLNTVKKINDSFRENAL